MHATTRQRKLFYVFGAAVVALAVGFIVFSVFAFNPLNADAAGGTTNGGCCGGGGGYSGNYGNGDNKTQRDNPPPKVVPPPVCTLSVYPTTIKPGESVKFTWTSKNGTSATFTPIGSVALNGSHTMALYETRTYTFRVTGPGGARNCPATVTVKKPEKELTCKLYASKEYIKKGESVELKWRSTGANAGFIDEGVGSVEPNGSTTVSPEYTTTYIGTFWNNYKDVTCEVTVNVKKKYYGDDKYDQDEYDKDYGDKYQSMDSSSPGGYQGKRD